MLTILSGPAHSGKTERLLSHYRTALTQRPPGATLWLAPTWRAAAEVRQRLFDGTFRGCFSPGVMTFGKFAETVLHASGLPIRPIDRLMKRELVRQILEEQAARERLSHFRSIASTGGLADLVCEFIGELKRLEIWPEEFHRACASRGIGDKDVELAEIYESYQQALREHGLFDAEGRFWSARDVLAKADDAKTGFQFVAIDGFADFTRTQHEIIEILAARAETTIVTLPLEPNSQRADLFTKPQKTLAELRRRHSTLQIEEVVRPEATNWPAMRRLEQTIFVNPRTRQEADKPKPAIAEKKDLRIEILAAARQVGEIELLAGRIKRLLVDGEARPGDVAVVFRSPQEVGGTVGEIFGRTGIPVVFESGHSLDRSSALRALAHLVQLDIDDWPFDQVLAVLGNNFFAPNWREWRNGRALPDLERAVRRLQVPRGRERLIEQLREESGKQQEGQAGSVDRLSLDIVQRLAQALDALPQRATLPDWSKAWQRLAEETGVLRAMQASDGESLSDRLAWNRLLEVLAAGDTLAGWLKRRPPELDRRAAVDALLDILRSECVGHAGDESGYVRVLSASSIRSLRIPYLFLAGLSEKAFPPPDREDRLYSEAEYGRLIEVGLPFVARTERTREEMLLFYEAVTRASKRLYLSYPALDESAQPLLPSPFLREVEDAFAGQIPRIERADLSPVPTDDEPVNDAEFRIKAMDTALKGNVALLAGLFRWERGEGREETKEGKDAAAAGLSLADNLAAGMDLLDLRLDRDRFGPAEGVLQGSDAHRRLANLFPPKHTFSATELERYASCPFQFFLERVLKIEPIEDLALEFDVLERGSTVHGVMAALHRRVNERLGRPGSPLELDAAEYDAILDAAIQESLPPEPANPLRAAMREIDRRLIVQWMSQYRDQMEKYDQQWQGFTRPMAAELLEVSFGRGDELPPSTGQTLDFTRDAQTVHISGRIDRVDTGVVAGEVVFNILDYKTGGSIKMTPETIQAGTTLQLPLYALAAMELLLADHDAIPWQAGYWYVRTGGFKPRQALKMYRNDNGRIELETAWEDIRAGIGDTVVALARAIRKGQFPVCSADDHCTGRCPYSTICRINQVRSLEKTCQPANP